MSDQLAIDALPAILERAAPGPSFMFDARAIRASDMLVHSLRDTYGYCEETGEPIGLKRLDARFGGGRGHGSQFARTR
jgi:Prokaryotic dksA/traR C4-type zinc finger